MPESPPGPYPAAGGYPGGAAYTYNTSYPAAGGYPGAAHNTVSYPGGAVHPSAYGGYPAKPHMQPQQQPQPHMMYPGAYGGNVIVVESPDASVESNYVDQCSEMVRRGFIRKVYGILFAQLMVTLSVVLLFAFEKSIARSVQRAPGVLFGSLVGSFATLIALSCFPSVARSYPGNMVCLGLFTIFESILVGSIASSYTADSVVKVSARSRACVRVATLARRRSMAHHTPAPPPIP
jgi:hypothetical protein